MWKHSQNMNDESKPLQHAKGDQWLMQPHGRHGCMGSNDVALLEVDLRFDVETEPNYDDFFGAAWRSTVSLVQSCGIAP